MATAADAEADTDADVDDVQALDGRDAAALTSCMTVLPETGRARGAADLFLVVSESGREYLVDVRQECCECDDSFYRDPDGGCKHVRRAKFATGRRDVPDWADQSAIDPLLGQCCETTTEADQ